LGAIIFIFFPIREKTNKKADGGGKKNLRVRMLTFYAGVWFKATGLRFAPWRIISRNVIRHFFSPNLSSQAASMPPEII
jgi:hypothetical protein